MPKSETGISLRGLAFELDGVFAGCIQSVEGGYATADVITEGLRQENILKKHIGNVRYEDITITCGIGMSKDFYQWIQSVFDMRNRLEKNGAVIMLDYDGMEIDRLEFSNALITEVSMPAIDAASKSPAYMRIKIAPGYTRRSNALKGKSFKDELTKSSNNKKIWLSSNFKLNISGIETKKVNRIDALTLKQKLIEHPVDEGRGARRGIPAVTEYPNLIISFSEANNDAFYKWYEDFVINGNNGQGSEKSGTLEYLAQNLKNILFQIKFEGLGIFKCSPEKIECQNENIRRIKAEIYCKKIGLTWEGGISNQT